MGSPLFLVLGVIVMLLGWDAAAQTSNSSCPTKFTVGETKNYHVCNDLNLGATLSYNYHVENGSLEIAFKAKPSASGGWVGWGINPHGLRMIGTQALIAFRWSNGTIVVDTYNVVSKSVALNPSKISINVTKKSVVYESSSGKITIFASLLLDSNQTSATQVWQVGSSVTNLRPGIHKTGGANLESLGMLDLQSEATSAPPSPTTQTSNSSCPLKFTVGETKTYQACNNLSLGATLSYNYHAENGSLDIAFKAAPAASGGWVGWGINPQRLAMIGTQALIAFRLGNGSTVVDTYNVTSKSADLNPSKISINVTNKSAVYESSSGKITIFASLVLDSNQNIINQVWQVGSSISGLIPGIHSTTTADLSSLGTLNLQSEATSAPPSPTAQTSNSSCPLKFTVGEPKTYHACNKLNLGATLSYNYHAKNGLLDIAFNAGPSASGGWVSWGINPHGLQMIGTQALIAFRLSNGSTVVDTYDVISKSGALNPSNISLNVISKSAVYEGSNGKITIFASLVLDSNQTNVNQVWQVGSSVTNLSPGIHSIKAADLNTLRTLDLLSGATSAPPGESSPPAVNNTPSTETSNSNCPLKFTKGETKTYKFCSNLNLGATLSYIYHVPNRSLDIAFKAAPTASGGWVGWGINPKGLAMIGTQALIAFRLSNGSTVVDTYDVVSKSAALNPSAISLNVINKSAVYESSSGKIAIFASLVLDSNQTSVNQVWQVGSSVTNLSPGIHSTKPADLKSSGTLDLLSGATSASGGSSHQTLKNRHGIITVVSWGILMPIGVMIARYVKTFESADPAWFYLHVICQSSGYVIGVAGWATGLKLGSYSKGVEQTSHRTVGIVLFALATLQVVALLLRPKKDNKFRVYWNIYHHSVGYSVIVLSIINIFKGFDILDPEKKWKNAYIGVIIALSAITVILEIVTWIIHFQRKSRNSSKPITEMNGNS